MEGYVENAAQGFGPGGMKRDGLRVAEENWQRYQYGKSRGHDDYVARAALCENFYLGAGRQWREEDRRLLESQGRPAYEFNEVMPALNSAIGYQIHNRLDISFRPKNSEADDERATILSKIAMHIAAQAKLHWQETQVFADGLIEQRGYFDVRLAFDDSLRGEVAVTALDPRDVIPDPDAKSYDPDDWSDVILMRWMTGDEIAQTYGEEARQKLEEADGLDGGDWQDRDEMERNHFGNDAGQGDAWFGGGEGSGAGPRRYRVVDRQQFERRRMKVAVFPEGDIRPIAGPEDEQEALAAGAVLTRRMQKVVRWTVSTRSVVLHDDLSPFPWFTVVPFFAYFRRGKTAGMVDNAIDPQQALNKAVSQYVHIINTTANSGWLVEQNSLTNLDTEDLAEEGARTGLVVEYRQGSAPPMKIQANGVPPGVDQMIQRASFAVKDATVPDALRGNQGPEISGIAIQSRQFAAQQGLALPLDNLARTRHMVAQRMLYLIQHYYDEPRVFRITDLDQETGREQSREIAANTFDPATGRIANDLTAGEYDIVIAEQPMQITFENSQFEQALELRRVGVQIPDSVVIRHSNLMEKADIIQQSSRQPDPAAQAQAQLIQAQAALEQARAARAQAEIPRLKVATQREALAAARRAVAPTAPLAAGILQAAGFGAEMAPGGQGMVPEDAAGLQGGGAPAGVSAGEVTGGVAG